MLDSPVDSLDDERAYDPAAVDVRGAVLAMPEAERPDLPLEELPSFGQAWALGFVAGVTGWPEEWAPPREKEAAALLEDAMSTIFELAGPDTGKPSISIYADDGPPTVSDKRLEQFGEAIWAVYDLRALWKSLGPRIESVRKEPTPGRNDPCPCGSGKKYKKCHGA